MRLGNQHIHCPHCHHHPHDRLLADKAAYRRQQRPRPVRRRDDGSCRSSTLLLTCGMFVLGISLFQNQHLLRQLKVTIPIHVMPGVFLPSSSSLPSAAAASSMTTSARTSRATTTTTAHHSRQDHSDVSINDQNECTLINGTRVTLSPEHGNNTSRIQIPTFIIIGVHKGGTTALRELLQVQVHHTNSHNQQSDVQTTNIVPSIKREPHYFDWHYEGIIKTLYGNDNDKAATLEDKRERFRRGLCEVRFEYMTQHFDMNKFIPGTNAQDNASALYYSYEKTPSYIIKPGIAGLIKQVLPWTKIIVSLRNPIDRCISHYRMDIEREYDDKTFEEWLAHDLNILQRLNYTLPPLSSMPASLRQAFDKILLKENPHVRRGWEATSLLYRGLYAQQLREWLEHYTLGQDLYILPFERLKQHPKEALQDMLRFLQIPTASTSSTSLLGQSNTDSNKQHDHAYRQSYSPNRGELDVTISTELRDYLRRLLKPYNDDLASLLSSSLAASSTSAAHQHDDGNVKWLQDMTRHWN